MKKILALILAVCCVFAFAACGEKEENPSNENENNEQTENNEQAENNEQTENNEQGEDVKVMTYDEYIAAEVDAPVVIEAYVQAKQSWWEDKATVYTQDQDGAYFIYNMACSEEDYAKLVPGTKIRVTGYKAEWSGEVEIAEGATFEILEGADTFIAEPIDVTALLNTEDLIKYQNQFASFKNMTVEASQDKDGNPVAFLYKWDGSGEDGDDLYFNVSSEGNTYSFTVESYLCDNTTEVYNAVKALNIGDVIDLEGFIYWYEGLNPHITAVAPVSEIAE